MPLLETLRRLGGVTRMSRLNRLGYSDYRVNKEMASLVRPRAGWIALKTADPELILAAKHGVVLGCVTQARRLGLWVAEQDELHTVCTRLARRRPELEGTVHWNRALVPRDPNSLVDPVENVLDLVAKCRPFEQALTVFDSALNKGLVSRSALTSLRLGPNAREVLQQSTQFSDSGLETIFRTRLRWLNVAVRPQVWLCGRRVDFLIGDRLVIQLDGGHHVGVQRNADNLHDAQLNQNGYFVIRVGYSQVMHDWPAVQELVLGAIARELHLAR